MLRFRARRAVGDANDHGMDAEQRFVESLALETAENTRFADELAARFSASHTHASSASAEGATIAPAYPHALRQQEASSQSQLPSAPSEAPKAGTSHFTHETRVLSRHARAPETEAAPALKRRAPAMFAAALRRRLTFVRTVSTTPTPVLISMPTPIPAEHFDVFDIGASSTHAVSEHDASDCPYPAESAKDDAAADAETASSDAFAGLGFERVDDEELLNTSDDSDAARPGSRLPSAAAEAVLTMSALTVGSHAVCDAAETGAAARSSSAVSVVSAGALGSRYTRIATRARRALRTLTDVHLRTVTDAHLTGGARSSGVELSTSDVTSAAAAAAVAAAAATAACAASGVSLHLTTVNGKHVVVLSRKPRPGDLNLDLQCMRDRFPNVPKYAGNPPWLTRFHPDLVRPPTHA